MQTILGANGTIGQLAAAQLRLKQVPLRLVSRTPKYYTDGVQPFEANLLNAKETLSAVNGSKVVYLIAGLTYSTEAWEKEWPLVMTNVINACKETGASLVFFDNVYAYGKVEGWMTEDTPINPCSKKGEVRAKIARQLEDEWTRGNLKAIIARSADFYGPFAYNSFVHHLVFSRFLKKKSAQWFLDAKQPHSFTYTPDAAQGMIMLGNDPNAFNQVWHLPTHKEALNGEEFMKMAATGLLAIPHYKLLPHWKLRLTSLFVPEVKESMEMMYQYNSPYLFSSAKFEQSFRFDPTGYTRGIIATANHLLALAKK